MISSDYVFLIDEYNKRIDIKSSPQLRILQLILPASKKKPLRNKMRRKKFQSDGERSKKTGEQEKEMDSECAEHTLWYLRVDVIVCSFCMHTKFAAIYFFNVLNLRIQFALYAARLPLFSIHFVLFVCYSWVFCCFFVAFPSFFSLSRLYSVTFRTFIWCLKF